MKISSSLLFAIKRYALHGGPNIRTTLFFKGCPLNCFWCHNPEGISSHIEVATVNDRCIGCRECLHGCPESALTFSETGLHRQQEECTTCLNCVEICPTLAHEALGYYSSTDGVMAEIEKDLSLYDQSGGGVFFSGGEPLMQPEALLDLLKRCGNRGIHRTVDTTGFAPTSTLLQMAEHIDLLLYNLKHMNSLRHREYTGVPNELILYNLKQLAKISATYRIGIPLVAGVNDDDENIRAVAEFATTLSGLEGIDILPYHHMATTKYVKLQSGYSGKPHHCPGKNDIFRVQSILEHFGHKVRIGG